MGIGAYVLGGAMQGLGQGMMRNEIAKFEDRKDLRAAAMQERRDLALAKLREGQIKLQGDITSRNQAMQDKRERDMRIELQARDQQFGVAKLGASANAAREERESREEFEIRKLRIQNALDSDADMRRIAAEAANEGKKVKDVLTDGKTGAVSVIFADGTGQFLPNIISRPKPDSDRLLFNTEPARAQPVKPIQVGRDAKGNLVWPETPPPPGFKILD